MESPDFTVSTIADITIENVKNYLEQLGYDVDGLDHETLEEITNDLGYLLENDMLDTGSESCSTPSLMSPSDITSVNRNDTPSSPLCDVSLDEIAVALQELGYITDDNCIVIENGSKVKVTPNILREFANELANIDNSVRSTPVSGRTSLRQEPFLEIKNNYAVYGSSPVSSMYSTDTVHTTRRYYKSSQKENQVPANNKKSLRDAGIQTNIEIKKVTKSTSLISGFIRARPYTEYLPRRKTDPVNRFHQHQAEWKNAKGIQQKKKNEIYSYLPQILNKPAGAPKRHNFAAMRNHYVPPSDKMRRELCWQIRERTILQKRKDMYIDRKNHPIVKNNYETPTSKKRNDLRWAVRQLMT